MAYQKKANDVKFRIVSLNSGIEDGFKNFDANPVDYKRNCVLEVQKADGTTTIEYEYDHFTVAVLREDKLIKLPKDVPTDRLWVRDRKTCGIAYKIPGKLEIRDENQIFEIPAGATAVEVFGDKYFSAVYDLIKP